MKLFLCFSGFWWGYFARIISLLFSISPSAKAVQVSQIASMPRVFLFMSSLLYLDYMKINVLFRFLKIVEDFPFLLELIECLYAVFAKPEFGGVTGADIVGSLESNV